MQVMSSQPKRQRKWHYSKALHLSHKEFSVHLSKELRGQLGRRNLEARKGDTVKVMRGDSKVISKQGKITAVMRRKRMVLVEGITRKKMDGKEIQIPVRPSNLMLVAIEEKDSRRLSAKKAENIKGGEHGKSG